MHSINHQTSRDTGNASTAVMSMALCVAVLIASEFLPVSLLTPIAQDLGVTEGHAGQAISISGLFAVITSLGLGRVTGGMDRKRVQTGLTALLTLSALIVTFAPNYPVLMIGRAILGVAVGGFWSMSTAIVMRLLPARSVPQGLAALNAGNAIAATIAAPLGSWLGDLVGWRGAFFLIVPLTLLTILGRSAAAVAVLLLLWGFFATAAPVGWGTWLARTLTDQAEAGSGLQAAVIQCAIMAGAAFGGMVFDRFGWQADFAMAAMLLTGASVMAGLAGAREITR